MKLMRGTPISTRQQFSAGGNMVPIATRSSAQSVAGYQQMGTSVGTTKLGAYRMGDTDGNAPPSAIYPGDIFSPVRPPERKYADVTFESVGNRVFQPPGDDMKLHSLLKKFGDQKFKAEQSAPFEEYFRIQALARQTDEAARFAGIEELGGAREIMRNLVDARRQGNEDDFMRRMLDSGMSMEDAQDEIDNVRRASALQESRTVDDRSYQSKLLLSRIAQSRGAASQVKDPLTQSAAISNPQNSQDAHLAMGMKDEGFGTNPIDINRQFMTADFYRKFGRKMPQSQEAQDSMAAVNYLISQGSAGDITNVSQVKGLERAEAIQRQREFAASKLETLRNRGTKVMLPLPDFFFSEPLLKQVYGSRKAGETTYFTTEDSQTLTHTQGIVAMNQYLASDPTGKIRKEASEFLKQYRIIRADSKTNPEVFEILRLLVSELSNGATVSLPFVGKTLPFGADSNNLEMLGKALDDIRTNPKSAGTVLADAKRYQDLIQNQFENPRGEGPPPPEATRLAVGSTAVPEVVIGATPLAQFGTPKYPAGFMNILDKIQPAPPAMRQPARQPAMSTAPPPMRQPARQPKGNTRVGYIPTSDELAVMTKNQLKAEATKLNATVYGTKADLIGKIEAKRQEIEG